ncbi:signal recognition particle-docking protein FtsY [Leptothermofonsia sichuanensis E412]|uniref:signal recognition particle-docking protein FtsY n=1 Tax=Leptothermofonsia sichuanensis TaxID=2917832 RepID=UPI001CA77AAD|nr:signal recognition particle-docking protein FtsY [Leptothermofonsia sichuanensis]QZZ19624.1 signal recognition particle-docking protein FtsY [Leptothermofonsia sichuanensis E412]
MAFDWFRRRFNQQDEEVPAAEPAEAKAEQVESEQSEPEPQEGAAPTGVSEDYLSWAKAAYQNIQKRQQAEAATPAIAPSETPAIAAEIPVTEPKPAIAEPEIVVPEPVDQSAVIEAEQPSQATIPPPIEPVTGQVEEPAPTELPTGLEEPPPEISGTAQDTSGNLVSSEELPYPEVETPSSEILESAAESAPEAEIPSPEPALSVPEALAETIPPPVEPPAEPATPLPFWAESEAERQARLERLKETAIVEPEPETVSSAVVEVPVESPAEPPEDLILDEGFLWSAEVLAAQGRRPDQVSLEEITWLKRLRQGLDKTRRGLVNQLRAIVGQGPLNQDAVSEIEAALLQADVGVAATDAIIEALQQKLRDEVLPPDAALSYLKQILRDMLDAPLNEANYFFAPQKDILNIWLITGVNGAGKTTTIGKLAHIAQKSGYKCLIAAADTFRAAAVEQVKVWGGRSGVEVIANPGQNTDPAAVVFDAIAAAQARGTELLLVDTAGRLQNKKNLMDELSKIRRIIDKKADKAVVESLLVLDATLGQNGLRQAEVFSEVAQLSGVVLTKLDGTAKGGIALAVVQQLGIPIRFIGAGEGIEDLRPFSSYEFIEALLSG